MSKDRAYHPLPITCCSGIAAGGKGSVIKARPVPDDDIPRLLFGNTKSTMKGLRTGKDGKLTSVSLAGSLRKMSPETFEIFEGLFADE